MATSFTPSEELALEVLAARARLGENVWTFRSRHRKPLESLASKGLVFTMHGVVEDTMRAGLTEEGRASVLSPNYNPPQPEATGTGLGSNLFRARRASGMTQTQAAAALSTTPTTISRYESGDRTPDIHNLVGLANAYGTSVQNLIEGGIHASEGATEDSRKARD